MKHAPRRADAKGPTVQASRSVRGTTFPNSGCRRCPVPCRSTRPQGRLPQHRFSLASLYLTLSAQVRRVKGDVWGTASFSTSTREGRLISALHLLLHARARRKRTASSPRCLRKHLAKTRCRRMVLPAQYFISSGVGRQRQSDGSPYGWEWDLLALAAAARKGSFSPPLWQSIQYFLGLCYHNIECGVHIDLHYHNRNGNLGEITEVKYRNPANSYSRHCSPRR